MWKHEGDVDLDPGVDYLWCPACKIHVKCLRNDEGWWEVQCPQCVGECGFCRCHLREMCFGMRRDAPPIRAGSVAPDCPHPKH